MILIADSGSTKTAWRSIDNEGKTETFFSRGFNPYFWKSADIAREINRKCPAAVKSQISKSQSRIFFYGAGCSSRQRINIVKTALKRVFRGKPSIHVEHDLLGAARAVCGRKKGIAVILGTGSNSCLFDGNEIIAQRGGWGFIISDEGSGAHIGKKLMQDFVNGNLPDELSEKLKAKHKLTREKLLRAVYNEPFPNLFLASFAKFVHENISAEYCRQLVKSSFSQFLDNIICRYENYRDYKMGCVGSVGLHFKNLLEEEAAKRGVQPGKFTDSPIDELEKYHSPFKQ